MLSLLSLEHMKLRSLPRSSVSVSQVDVKQKGNRHPLDFSKKRGRRNINGMLQVFIELAFLVAQAVSCLCLMLPEVYPLFRQ